MYELLNAVIVLAILTITTATLFKLLWFSSQTKITSIEEMDEIDQAMLVKYPEFDIHNDRKFTYGIAFLLAMIFTWALLEIMISDSKVAVQSIEIKDLAVETIEIPPTTAEPPPPPPPPQKTVTKVFEVTDKDLLEDEDFKEEEPREGGFIWDLDEEEYIEEDIEEEAVIEYHDFVEYDALPHTGDIESYSAWVSSRMNKNAIKRDINAGLKGVVAFKVAINPDGRISSVEQLDGSSVGPNIDREIRRVLQTLSPPWKPAKLDGQYVGQYIEVPFNIVY